jgi:hypothetical protein
MTKDHDPRGWVNFCTVVQADGKMCGRDVWFLWVASRHSAIHMEVLPNGEPSEVNHRHRDELEVTA